MLAVEICMYSIMWFVKGEGGGGMSGHSGTKSVGQEKGAPSHLIHPV